MNCSTLHCVELSDGDFPLEFTNTNFEGHYGSLQLIGMGPPSENLTQVPTGAINGVTFDTVFILQSITIGTTVACLITAPYDYSAHLPGQSY